MKPPTALLIVTLITSFFLIAPAIASDPKPTCPSAKMVGTFDVNEKALLGPAFINGVNRYLRRHAPILKERNENSIKMTAKYECLLNIDLYIINNEYEIIVTAPDKKPNNRRAQNVCVKIATGANKAMSDYLVKGTRIRDKTSSDGLR